MRQDPVAVGFIQAADGEFESLTDEELCELAMAGDPESSLDENAVPLRDLSQVGAAGLLPDWYMPSPHGARQLDGWRRRVVLVVIASFVLINAYGLCSTYGAVGFG